MTLLPTFGGGRAAGAADLGSLIDGYDTPYGDYLGAKLDQGWWGALNGAVLGGFYKRYGLPAPATDELFSDPAEVAKVRAFRTTPTVSVPPPFRQSEQELIEGRLAAKGIEYLTEDRWKAGPWYRDMPFEPYMTEARARAKAETFDLNRYRDWRIQQRQNGVLGAVTGFGAQLVGGIPDPINFVGFGGFAAKGATLLRTMGRGALEVGAVTATAEPFLVKNLDFWGEDMTFADAVLDVALGAATGGLFAGGGRVARMLEDLRRERRSVALGEARQAIQEATDLSARAETLGTGYDPATAKAAPEAIARLNDTVEALATQRERQQIAAGYDRTLREGPHGNPDEVLAAIDRSEIEQVLLTRGAALERNGEIAVTGRALARAFGTERGYGLVKVLWKHGERSDKDPAFRVTRDDVLALPEVVRGYEPLPARRGNLREWRVERDGRTLVYAAAKWDGAERVVSIHVWDRGDRPVLSRKREAGAAPRSSGELARLPGDTASGAFRSPAEGPGAAPASETIGRQAPEVETLARETAEPAPDPLKDAEADPDVQAYRELEQAGAVDAEDKRAFEDAEAQVQKAESIEKAYQQASVCLARGGA